MREESLDDVQIGTEKLNKFARMICISHETLDKSLKISNMNTI